ncbi:MAG: LysE family translocator [Pseudomonadota bacterium]|nr:LysE family translocator [Pseudomonadota bacterium]
MSWTEFTALLVLATAVSFTPGPNTTLSTALAVNAGLRGAMPFIGAVPVGWSCLLLLCAGGVGAAVAAVAPLRWAVLLLGVGYMLWLAWRLAHSAALAQAPNQTGRGAGVGFVQGVGLQFLNLKAWMLALSIVAGWVAGRPDAPARLGLVLPVMAVFAFASNFTYALVGALLRRWLAQGRRLLWFNRAMALALAATAGWMAWSAMDMNAIHSEAACAFCTSANGHFSS